MTVLALPSLSAAKLEARSKAELRASLNAPLSAPKGSTERQAMPSLLKHRESLPPDGQSFSTAITEALAHDQRTDKQLARDVRAVPRTVKAWREGANVPSLPAFFRLCMEMPELRAQALRWLESERNLDPDHERATMELLKAATAVLERRQRKLEGEG